MLLDRRVVSAAWPLVRLRKNAYGGHRIKPHGLYARLSRPRRPAGPRRQWSKSVSQMTVSPHSRGRLVSGRLWNEGVDLRHGVSVASGNGGHTLPLRVLDADRDLADALEDHELAEARCALIAPVITLMKGKWSPSQAIPVEPGHLGVLVTEGILCREVAIGESVCAELVGPGDLLRPWSAGGAGVLVSCDVHWHVLQDARLAILGRRFVASAARWPALTSALVGRAISRSHALALSATISCTTGLEARLSMLFWHMAERWGKVRPDGIVVPINLTHELIGRLIGARRPSVSTTLKQLERQGILKRIKGGWLLAGDPPGTPANGARAHVDRPDLVDDRAGNRNAVSADQRRATARHHRDDVRARRPAALTPAPSHPAARAVTP